MFSMAMSAVPRRRTICGDTTSRMRRRDLLCDLLALPLTLHAQNATFLTGLTGTASLPAAPLELRAGPLSLVFDPGLGLVRYIRFGEHEVLRGIYAAVRDKNWGTVAPKISNLKTITSPDSFRLDFDVTCQERDIDFAWHGTVIGEASGKLQFDFQGQARRTFERNRIGFCVLHPLAECAGKPCQAELADGSVIKGEFPSLIAPTQPFINLRAVSHRLPDGTNVEVHFAGDVFEMEDHRNWTDGNFKTYCTALALPFPVTVKQGTRIEQSVIVKVTAKGTPAKAPSRGFVELSTCRGAGRLPTIGFGLAAAEQPLGPRETALLRVLKPAHLRVDLHLASPQWRELLASASKEAQALNAALEIAVMLGDNPEAELAALAALSPQNLKPARWLIFRTGEASTKAATIELASRILPGFLGSGTNQYFTELNRERPTLTHLRCVAYSLNPQVHAFDNQSLVENLAPQGDQVRSARKFCGTKPIAVTPVTLRPRFNPQQRGPEPPPTPGRLPSRIDYRQASLFAAAWTLGSLKYLCEADANSVTYYETHGWGGLLMPGASPLPDLFRSQPGMVFPMYHVFADLAEFAGGTYRELGTDSPLDAISLGLTLRHRRRTIVANLTAAPRIVRIPASNQMAIRTLDERTFTLATTDPVRFRQTQQTLTTSDGTLDLPLGPYAVVTLDVTLDH